MQLRSGLVVQSSAAAGQQPSAASGGWASIAAAPAPTPPAATATALQQQHQQLQQQQQDAVAASAAAAAAAAAATAAVREGVRLCFLRWTALQLAVENQWGGRRSRDKAMQLEEDVAAWLCAKSSRGTVHADELEDMLDESVLSSFHMEVDDGSLEEVSKALVELVTECARGNFDRVRMWQQQEQQQGSKPAAIAASQRQRGESEDDGSSSDEDDDEDMREDECDATMIDSTARVSSGQAAAADQQQVQQQGASGHAQGLVGEAAAAPAIDPDGWQTAGTRRRGRSGGRR